MEMPLLNLDPVKKEELSSAAKWLSGLLFTGVITAFRNLQLRRRQERLYEAHTKEIREHLNTTQEDRVVKMITELKEALTQQGRLTELRHDTNVNRFKVHEQRIDALSEDLKQERREMEGLRGEIRTTNGLLQKIIVDKILP